jgi:HlyD family secretion protein
LVLSAEVDNPMSYPGKHTVLALCLGVVAGAMLYPRLRSLVATDDVATTRLASAPNTAVQTSQQASQQTSNLAVLDVVALGRLLPSGGILAVAPPNGAGDARIARLLVKEAEVVVAGQVIAELDNLPQLVATQASEESTLAAQEAALAQVRASIVASLLEARANHAAAAAALMVAKQTLARFSTLAERKLTTQEILQQAQANAIKAKTEFDRTGALVTRFSGAESDSQPDIVLAARNRDLAQANLARANAELAAAHVVAPIAGTVLDIKARIGEKPSTAGVVSIGNVEQMTAELEVYQSDIRQVVLKQVVDLRALALNAPLTGKVTSIGQIVGRQSVMSNEAAANADARVIKVTVLLDAESSARARAYSNLEVVGTIRARAE